MATSNISAIETAAMLQVIALLSFILWLRHVAQNIQKKKTNIHSDISSEGIKLTWECESPKSNKFICRIIRASCIRLLKLVPYSSEIYLAHNTVFSKNCSFPLITQATSNFLYFIKKNNNAMLANKKIWNERQLQFYITFYITWLWQITAVWISAHVTFRAQQNSLHNSSRTAI